MPGRLEIARMLREIGALLQLQGENTFRARAYERAATALEAFGGKTQARLLEGIAGLSQRATRLLLHRALAAGTLLVEHVSASPAIRRAAIAGSLRRRAETVGSLDVLASTAEPAAALDAFAAY